MYSGGQRVQFYVFPRVKPEGIHKTARRVQITFTLEAMVQLSCSALLIVNYVFTVLKRNHSCHGALIYPRVY